MTSANITLIPAWSGKYDIGIFRGCNNDFTLDGAATYQQVLLFRIINEPDFAEKLLDLQGKTIACLCEDVKTCHGLQLIRAVDYIIEHGGAEAVRQIELPPFYDVHPIKIKNEKGIPVANPLAGKMMNRPHPRVAGWEPPTTVEEIEAPF